MDTTIQVKYTDDKTFMQTLFDKYNYNYIKIYEREYSTKINDINKYTERLSKLIVDAEDERLDVFVANIYNDCATTMFFYLDASFIDFTEDIGTDKLDVIHGESQDMYYMIKRLYNVELQLLRNTLTEFEKYEFDQDIELCVQTISQYGEFMQNHTGNTATNEICSKSFVVV